MSELNNTILLVEDEVPLQILIEDSLEEVCESVFLQVVENGEEALNYLRGQGAYKDRSHYPLPMLILTDINMPGMSGLELLAWVKQQPELKDIPVVVMSNSRKLDQAKQAINLGAKSYFDKLSSFKNLISHVKTILA